MNYSKPCRKCKSKIIIICNYNLLHMGNMFDAGVLVSVNAKFIDINMVNFNIVCEAWDYTSVQKDVIPAVNSIFNCFACHVKIEVSYSLLTLISSDMEVCIWKKLNQTILMEWVNTKE